MSVSETAQLTAEDQTITQPATKTPAFQWTNGVTEVLVLGQKCGAPQPAMARTV